MGGLIPLEEGIAAVAIAELAEFAFKIRGKSTTVINPSVVLNCPASPLVYWEYNYTNKHRNMHALSRTTQLH